MLGENVIRFDNYTTKLNVHYQISLLSSLFSLLSSLFSLLSSLLSFLSSFLSPQTAPLSGPLLNSITPKHQPV